MGGAIFAPSLGEKRAAQERIRRRIPLSVPPPLGDERGQISICGESLLSDVKRCPLHPLEPGFVVRSPARFVRL
jgi:hypothetical protein